MVANLVGFLVFKETIILQSSLQTISAFPGIIYKICNYHPYRGVPSRLSLENQSLFLFYSYVVSITQTVDMKQYHYQITNISTPFAISLPLFNRVEAAMKSTIDFICPVSQPVG